MADTERKITETELREIFYKSLAMLTENRVDLASMCAGMAESFVEEFNIYVKETQPERRATAASC